MNFFVLSSIQVVYFPGTMGCGTSKQSTYEDPRQSGGPSNGLSGRKKRPTIGIGQPLGGQKKEVDVRQAQLEAAEKRAVVNANRGLTGVKRGSDLSEALKKQELIGKITAHYQV
jgi:hypothetical protein